MQASICRDGVFCKDCLGDGDMQKVRSADARACIAVCRPVGQFFAHRRLSNTRSMPTMPHQTGDLPLESLSVQQDLARGMFSSCVTSDTFRENVFRLQPAEKPAVVNTLQWLDHHNPWLAAYKASLQDMNGSFDAMTDAISKSGHAVPGGFLVLDASYVMGGCAYACACHIVRAWHVGMSTEWVRNAPSQVYITS